MDLLLDSEGHITLHKYLPRCARNPRPQASGPWRAGVTEGRSAKRIRYAAAPPALIALLLF